MNKDKQRTDAMFSKSFKKGFVDGFTSPVNLFISKPIQRPSEFDASVERAWKGVGRSLSVATKQQGEAIGKATRAKGQKPRAA